MYTVKGYVGSKEKLRQYFTEYFVSKAHSFSSFRALFFGELERYIPVQKVPLFLVDFLVFGREHWWFICIFVKEDRMCRLKTGMGLRFYTLKFYIGFCTYHSLLGDCGIFLFDIFPHLLLKIQSAHQKMLRQKTKI